MKRRTTVHLVGAGPGDPELLTVRAERRLREADLVYCPPPLVSLVRRVAPSAALRLVTTRPDEAAGGGSGPSPIPPADVPAALARAGADGRHVVRLYPGDPFTLGAGAREARALRRAGALFEVVSGVPTPVAAAGHAGVPLAPRGPAAVGLRGEEAAGGPTPEEPPGSGVDGGMAVVVGSAATLREGGSRLVVEGWSPDEPAVLVERPASPGQRTENGTLGDLAEGDLRPSGRGAAVALAGEAADPKERMAWFENRPLFGRTVVVTRPREQAEAFSAALRELGGEVVEFPTIRIDPPQDRAPLLEALGSLDAYDWVIFTSVNGVARVREALSELGLDARGFAGARLAAIGPATAGALSAMGLRADAVPDEYRAEALVEAVLQEASSVEASRVLLARAAGARAVLRERLRDAGARVDEVAAYRTDVAADGSGELRRLLEAGRVDWLTFTASSTVENFARTVGTDVDGARVAVIGPVTAGTADELGIPVHVVAEDYTIPGLVEALVRAEEDRETTA